MREYNLALGQPGADGAKRYLENLGLDAKRITATSNGKERPRVTRDSETAWKANRRDDLIPASSAISHASK